jgi:hypothetical protein
MAFEMTAEFVNTSTVERAYQLAQTMQYNANRGNNREQREAEDFAQRGMRAVRSKDQRTMIVLEQATEVLLKISNEQFGEYRQRNDIPESHRVEPTEVQMWREAYRMADEGTPLEHFKWVYGCAVKLAYGF